MAWSESVITPEAVVLERDIAHLGSRFIGALVDLLVQSAVILLAAAAAPVLSEDTAIIVVLVVTFAAIFVYPTLTETLWRGRSVGKAAAKIRVIRADGRPVTFPVAMVRNLLRIVDLLPSAYAIGAISILVTRRAQRIGDLAAGTIVVYEARAATPQVWAAPGGEEADRIAGTVDAGGLSSEDYQVVRAFLLRRDSLEPPARAALAARLAGTFRDRVAGPPDASAEVFLEAVAAAYRERHAR